MGGRRYDVVSAWLRSIAWWDEEEEYDLSGNNWVRISAKYLGEITDILFLALNGETPRPDLPRPLPGVIVS